MTWVHYDLYEAIITDEYMDETIMSTLWHEYIMTQVVYDLPTAFSLSLSVWSTNSLVFFGTFSLEFCAAGGPPLLSFSSIDAVRFNIFTIRPPSSGQYKN